MSNGGKGDKRRNENRSAVEANWPTNWNARDVQPTLQACEGGDEAGVDETDQQG